MHYITVVCKSCGKEFTYQTMFISTVGVAACPCCGLRDCATMPRGKAMSPGGHGSSELTGPPAHGRAD